VVTDALFRKFEALARLYPSAATSSFHGRPPTLFARIARAEARTLAARAIDGPALRDALAELQATPITARADRNDRADLTHRTDLTDHTTERAPAAVGTIREAHEANEKAAAVVLFSRYFASALSDVMPLLVHRHAACGFDFASTHTWVAYGAHNEQTPRPGLSGAAPSVHVAGAVAWRLHQPAAGSPLPPTLEVLFLAVEPHQRHAQCGRALVHALGAYARDQAEGAMLYVEVARHERTPKAFWTRHGLRDASEAASDQAGLISGEQRAFWEAHCWRFADTLQYVRMPGEPWEGTLAGEGDEGEACVGDATDESLLMLFPEDDDDL